MVATSDINAVKASAVAVSGAGPDIRVAKGSALALINYPTESIEASFGSIMPVVRQVADINVTMGTCMAIVAGRVSDPRILVWTFELDQHDYFVIRLGNDETLVYDLLADQWYSWGSGDLQIWRAFTGARWLNAGSNALFYGSGVVVGDDSNGTLWFLDPMADIDEDAVEGADRSRAFLRKATGQVAKRGYGYDPCYGIELLGSVGQSSLEEVTLFTSDDRGRSYDDRGTIAVAPDEYDTRLNWRSLGSMKAPGRLFRVEDRGALKRIDSLTQEDGDEQDG